MYRQLLAATALFGAAALSYSLNAHEVDDEPGARVRNYDVRDFSHISITGVYEMDVRVGGDYSLVLSGPAKEMDNVTVDVEGDVLVLGSKLKRRNNDDGVKAELTLPSLNGIDITGVGEFDVEGVNAKRFDLNVSGVGEIEIEGRCGQLNANISGVGEIDTSELFCESATLDMSGVGEASIYASENADIDSSGIGEVNVYGSPKVVNKGRRGFGAINFK